MFALYGVCVAFLVYELGELMHGIHVLMSKLCSGVYAMGVNASSQRVLEGLWLIFV